MLIHVGYPKTASTWLQQDLFSSPAAGFWYPYRIEAKEQFLLSDPYRFSAERVRGVFEPGIDEAQQRGLVAVISDEWLIGNQVTADYRGKQIAEQLAAVFPEARVLIVLRQQESMLLSSYREYVVCGGCETLEEFIGVAVVRPGFEPHCRLDHFEYDLALAHYRRLFSPEAVMVEPFERMVADPIKFYRRLAAFCGARGSYEQPEPAHNVGLRGATLTARRALNNLVHPFGLQFERGTWRRSTIARSAEWIGRVLPSIVHDRCESDLRRRLRAQVNGYYIESNRRTRDLIGIDLAAFGYQC
jgi:hypothetical protein